MRAMPNRNAQIGSRAVIVARLTLRPVCPQLRKCRVCPGSYAWCRRQKSKTRSPLVSAQREQLHQVIHDVTALNDLKAGRRDVLLSLPIETCAISPGDPGIP